MKQEIIKIPLSDFNKPVTIGQIISLESENFNQFMVKSINSKSVHLRKLIDIRDVTECSTTERKFIKMWILLHPNISLINQFPIHQYKADFFHVSSGTVIETHGGVWNYGGHNTGVGVTSDCKKLCLCTSLGYKYFALTTEMINEEYLNMIANVVGV
jgi:hypothetical protein